MAAPQLDNATATSPGGAGGVDVSVIAGRPDEHGPLPAGTAGRRNRRALALADRRLFRRHHRLCPRAGRRRARRGRCPAAGAGFQQLAARRRPVASPPTARCWRPACGCSNGTARWCTPKPRSPMAAGRASAPAIPTSPAGSPTASSMSPSRTRTSPPQMEAMFEEDMRNSTEVVLSMSRSGFEKPTPVKERGQPRSAACRSRAAALRRHRSRQHAHRLVLASPAAAARANPWSCWAAGWRCSCLGSSPFCCRA